MRAASICSRSSDCSEVMKIRQAKGSHCQATMMITENSGWSVSQSTGCAPKNRHTCPSTP
jgi:hypothetical protein